VLTEPTDLDRTVLEAVLERQWGLRDQKLDYLPVGFGSHHWQALDSSGERRFVTVDDLGAGFQAGPDTDSAFAALDRAFRTAAALRVEAGLEFVVSPLADHEGAIIRRLTDRYAVTVSPFVEGKTSSFGPYESADERRYMGAALGRLHAATDRIPVALPRREDFALPSREALLEALNDLDRRWESGPFGEPARRLLRDSARGVQRRLEEYDELCARVRDAAQSWVLTHGEPHRANVIFDSDGRVHLVDWDTMLIAPRERDLRMVLGQDMIGWDEYVAATGHAHLSQEAIQLYNRWWDLADVALYIDLFRRPHESTEDTAASWDSLAEYLSKT